MIPGHLNRLRLTATREGTFRGQRTGTFLEPSCELLAANAKDFHSSPDLFILRDRTLTEKKSQVEVNAPILPIIPQHRPSAKKVVSMNMNEWADKYHGIMTENDKSNEALNEFASIFTEKTPILYGYGLLGRTLGATLKRLNIDYIAVDRNAETLRQETGFDVKTPHFLKEIHDVDRYALFASVNRLKVASIREDLADLSVTFPDPLSGYDTHVTLQSALCTVKRYKGEELAMKNCYECSILDNACPVLAGYLRDRNGYAAKPGQTTRAIKMIGYVLGNICTLNCQNCCESIPYIESSAKSFVPTDVVITDITRYAAACEYLTLLEFIGGEPFLHPGIVDILTDALKIPNIGVIHIFTNGTILPKRALCDVLSNPRIVTYISNYSSVLPEQTNNKIARTVQELETHGVSFVHGSNANWYDISSFELIGDNEAGLTERFEKCFLHTCNRLHRGALYRCPHHFSGVVLDKLTSDDVVRIHDGSEADLVARLDAFAAQPFADACRYCPMPFNAPFTAPGLQL